MAEIDIDLLVDFLLSANPTTFRFHLLDVAARCGRSTTLLSDGYHLEEVMSMMRI